jgi:hypothetical protein
LLTISIIAQTSQLKKPSKLQIEYLEVVKKLDSIQKIAQQDPQLMKEGEELKADMTEVMIKNDPSVENLIAERNQVEMQFAEAEKQNDRNKMVQLQETYKKLTDRIVEHQNKVLEDPSFNERAKTINEKVLKKMEEIDPSTPQLIEKLKELKAKLNGQN